MDILRIFCSVIVVSITLTIVYSSDQRSSSSQSALNALAKVYTKCESSDDIIHCLKMQALKLTQRAIKLPTIQVIDGISIVSRSSGDDHRIESRQYSLSDAKLDRELKNVSGDRLDEILFDRIGKLVSTHQLQLNVPRLMSFGQSEVGRLIEEGRKKKKKYLGHFLAAMALKAGILKMAYHSIAIVAGKALIIGKIALVISAIIGLKKLVSPEGHEKTTYEIVKHPHVQQSHSYSSSHGEFDSGHESGGGQFHRSLGGDDSDEMLMQDRIYRSQKPKNYKKN